MDFNSSTFKKKKNLPEIEKRGENLEKENFFQEGIELHKELLALSEKEEELIIKNDVTELMKIVEKKEETMARLKAWERKCQLAGKEKVPQESLSQLLGLTEQVRTKTAMIMSLLQTSLDYLYAQLDLLTQKEDAGIYSAHGQEFSSSSSFFSRRV